MYVTVRVSSRSHQFEKFASSPSPPPVPIMYLSIITWYSLATSLKIACTSLTSHGNLILLSLLGSNCACSSKIPAPNLSSTLRAVAGSSHCAGSVTTTSESTNLAWRRWNPWRLLEAAASSSARVPPFVLPSMSGTSSLISSLVMQMPRARTLSSVVGLLDSATLP